MQQHPMRAPWAGALILAAVLLSACGGGGGGGSTTSTPTGTTSTPGGTSTGSSGSGTGSSSSGSGGTTSGGVSGTASWNYTAVAPSRSGCATNEGTVYRVGASRAYTTLSSVPWGSLQACDQVLIDYSATPYRNIVYLSARGAAQRFITIQGVPGPGGERPIIDGDGAVDPGLGGLLNPNGGYVKAGLIVMGLSTNNTKPGYLHITGLSFRHASPSYNIITGSASNAWSAFVAAIYAAPVEYLAVTNCEFASNSMGLFVNSTNEESAASRGLLIANNWFHDNGISGNYSVHHAYTEAIGTVYEYNFFGAMVSGAGGDAVKDRSAGNIFRYNHFAGGTYMISLRDPESNEALESAATDPQGDLLIKHAFVYQNRFVFGPASSVVVGHGDGSFGHAPGNRFGNLFFYGNEVVSLHDWDNLANHAPSLFELLNPDTVTTVRAYNNLFYATSATNGGTAAPFALFTWQGLADFRSNWINAFIGHSATGTNGGTAVGTVFDGSGLNGLAAQSGSPGITDLAGGVYTLLGTSPYFSLNAALPAEVTVRNLAPAAGVMPVSAPFAGPAYGN